MTIDMEPPIPPDEGNSDLDKALHHLHEAESDLTKAQADEEMARVEDGRALHEIEEADKEIERAGHHKEDHWIVVNGERKVVCGDRVAFEELVQIAYPVPPPGTDVQFTVQYTRGPEIKPSGPLIEGQSVKIRDGMEFDVTPTNRS